MRYLVMSGPEKNGLLKPFAIQPEDVIFPEQPQTVCSKWVQHFIQKDASQWNATIKKN